MLWKYHFTHDILVKTVSRLYQQDSKIDGEKRGKLLSKYQHQLGIVLARIEKLEIASKHPDMGPVGDGLVTLMDQKLSTLDEKLHEISSKISATSAQIETYEKPSRKESKPRIQVSKIPNIRQQKISQPENMRERVEITTLTPLAKGSQSFDLSKSKVNIPQTTLQHSEPKTEYRPVIDTPRPNIPKPVSDPELLLEVLWELFALEFPRLVAEESILALIRVWVCLVLVYQ